MAGYGTQEARYNTRLAKQSREQVNLCTCGTEIDSTALLCQDCYGSIHSQPVGGIFELED